jgi:outer membrane protein with beta-barrel domain
MSTRATKAAAALALSLVAPAAVAAQSPSWSRPALVIFGQGGGNSALTDLNQAETAKLRTGWTAGGGVGLQFNQYVAVRGTFDIAKSKVEGVGAGALNSQKLTQYFYGGEVQLRYPTAGGIAPYVLLGAGAVTVDNTKDETFTRFTKFAGRGGIGLEYLTRSGVGLFAQGVASAYKLERFGFDKTQADILWTAGLSYRFQL